MDKTAVRLVSAFETIDELVFCGLMLTLPFGWQLSIIPNILFLVLMFRKVLMEHHKPSKKKIIYFAPILLFLISNLLSLIYSDNAGRGGDMIFNRLNLFILPLGFLFVDFNPGLARRGMRFFILGTMMAALISLVLSFANSVLIKEQMLCIAPTIDPFVKVLLDTDIHNNHFLGLNVSYFMHPSYFGLLISIAIMGLLNSQLNETKSWIIQKGGIPGFIVMGIMLVLLSTNGMLVTALAVILYVLVFASLKKQTLSMFSSWLVVFAILLATGLYFNPQMQTIIQGDVVESMEAKQKAAETTWSVIKENPVLGVGLGDLDTELVKAYINKGYLSHAEASLNPHNQFLQSYASVGILGILALLLMFVSIFVYSIKRKSMLMFGFGVVVIISFLFESMLNRYWGILTFSLFYSILYFLPLDLKTVDERDN